MCHFYINVIASDVISRKCISLTLKHVKAQLSEIKIFTHLKFCLATATHNFKWVKITNICIIWDQTFKHFDV